MKYKIGDVVKVGQNTTGWFGATGIVSEVNPRSFHPYRIDLHCLPLTISFKEAELDLFESDECPTCKTRPHKATNFTF